MKSTSVALKASAKTFRIMIGSARHRKFQLCR
jgi:hypothetical protein